MPWTGQVGRVLRPGRALRPARLLRALRHAAGRHAARRPAAAARPGHPGRAAPDLRARWARWSGCTRRPSTSSAAANVGRPGGPAEDRRLDGDGAPGREPDPGAVQPPRRWTSSRRPVPTAATRSSPDTLPPAKATPRLYLGVAAQGRSPKVVMLRVYLALLGAAQKGTTTLTEEGEPRQPGRPVHDAARLLQQPARAGRQPADRRGRGPQPAGRLRATASGSARRRGCSPTGRSTTRSSS